MARNNHGGRPPKPTALKLLQGNAGKRALNALEPKPDVGAPEMPAWLSTRGKNNWKRLAPTLEGMKVLTVADRDALALLCDAEAEFNAAREVVERHGLLIPTKTVTVKVSRNGVTETETTTVSWGVRPELAQYQEARRFARTMLVEFGLTPSSRSRVHAASPDKPADPLEEFLS